MTVGNLFRRHVGLLLVAVLAGAGRTQVSSTGVPPRPEFQGLTPAPMSGTVTLMPPPYPPWP